MLAAVEDRERPEGEIAGDAASRRVYPPSEVQGRLGVSASGLRRLAGIYERSVGPLPRDERGRVWPEESVEVLEQARAAVREQRAVSIEAALRGQETPQGDTADPGRVNVPNVPEAPFGGPRADTNAARAILEELRALRALVEEQNRRIGELEEAVRTGRELPEPAAPPDAPGDAPAGAEASGEGQGPPEASTGSGGSQGRPWWRRWFGG